MQPLFIIFGIHIILLNSKALTCQALQMQPKITCNINLIDCFISGGDEEDYYKLEHVDKEIIQKSFTIPYKNMPIQISIFNRLEQDMIQMKLICSLLLNYTYYNKKNKTDYMSYDTLKNYENIHLLESIKIETNILSEESCDEIYQLEDGRIILFCLKLFILNNIQQVQKEILFFFQNRMFRIKFNIIARRNRIKYKARINLQYHLFNVHIGKFFKLINKKSQLFWNPK
ncbi:unnamed protein product [Paramecium octaurelia]|uniref:Transmembrane protein n=1 Tax=Paramecium octaurelia TaxID=43137 RepID=A0A8S1XA42_PAROT|nr:unnamed protein product [Paramecium octaurelia]